MFVKWLRTNVYAAGLLTVARLWLGYEWLTAGWDKLTGGFDASSFLQGALKKAGGEHPAVSDWWAAFLRGFALPNVGLFNVLIPIGEFLVGLALILGLFTTFAALMGAVMNFAFLFSGTTSTNPQMVLVAIFILVASRNAGWFGLDYYALPSLDKLFKRRPPENTRTRTA